MSDRLNPAPGGSTQRLVRQTMVAAGGYWRPLAAVARLLEELGELSEASPDELAGELADLWIITTALADQFLIEVAEPGTRTHSAAPGDRASAAAALEAAGPIARVVNHYDGPKVPRAGSPLPTLGDAIGAFHETLAALADASGVDLSAAIEEKIARIHARGDIERFGRDGFDPSTAPLLAELAGVAAEGALPTRLWAAPDLGPGPLPAEARAEAARPWLEVFAKAARAERLEGFAVAGPVPPARSGASAWLGALVAALDATGCASAFKLAGVACSATAFEHPAGSRVCALVVVPQERR